MHTDYSTSMVTNKVVYTYAIRLNILRQERKTKERLKNEMASDLKIKNRINS